MPPGVAISFRSLAEPRARPQLNYTHRLKLQVKGKACNLHFVVGEVGSHSSWRQQTSLAVQGLRCMLLVKGHRFDPCSGKIPHATRCSQNKKKEKKSGGGYVDFPSTQAQIPRPGLSVSTAAWARGLIGDVGLLSTSVTRSSS